MGFPKIFFSLILLFLFFLSNFSFSQIIFKELPSYKPDFSDSSFFGLSNTRSIISLNGKWQVFSAEDKEPQKISVNVPSAFLGTGEFIFEKTFSLTKDQVFRNKVKLYFLGLNYVADILVNDIVVYKHRGGEYPFTIDLPKEILNSEKSNRISVKLSYNPDSENTIPVKQKFIFPVISGGINKDVYLYLEPNLSISNYDFNYSIDSKTNKLLLSISSKFENKDERKNIDTNNVKNDFEISITVFNADMTIAAKSKDEVFQIKSEEVKNLKQTLEISNPLFWSPGSPQLYKIEISLLHNKVLIDKVIKEFPVYFLSTGNNELTLNNQLFDFKGVTYVPSFGEYGSLASFKQMEEDIRFIAQTGFNSIRFAKSLPHPYFIRLCEKYGLLALIEIPLNYIPANISADPNFITGSKNYLSEFIKGYSKFGKFAAIGLGSSYLPFLEEHKILITELESIIPKGKGFLSYASFSRVNLSTINDLDLYGIEIVGESLVKDTLGLSASIELVGKGRLFISELTYFVNSGSSSGYINENTYEAQAKYFEDFIDALLNNKASGYFINSVFDYRGNYSSLLSGYNESNIYNIGLVSENRQTNYLSYKVIKSKLQNAERITIPIGTKSDKSPMAFIIIGLVLALIVGVLVNSGRKFRVDASRALLRPYNFYADIRDQRIISSYHSTVMAIIVAVIISLLISSLLYYLKDHIVFEKILLSFGSVTLINTVSYLAWNSFKAITLLTIFFCILMILMVIIIKFFSLFVKNRVNFSSVYFTVVWSFLPLVLLIPVGIVLYRALEADVANLYIYIAFIIFAAWIFYRLMKGIYVIFDINPSRVYMYSIIVLLILASTFILYYEFGNSLSDYLLLTFKQYNISDLL